MPDDPRQDAAGAAGDRRRHHLRAVPDDAAGRCGARPRTIGRLIAQTALIADGALHRRAVEPIRRERGMLGLLGLRR